LDDLLIILGIDEDKIEDLMFEEEDKVSKEGIK
jgi:hypothetical protein